ncbi:PREDICTED: TBC1 domain family member 1 [Ceratosolen solmsi marchali]|uniref:TBC1 domain family member 1 n=1 Tax=Ceratosolen solmsi marchali TaxID=326594 RepID=A0AAJ6YKB9_9HYME|nr:PREDICTED: TBC1 domain family member 1 [Ceratosolen solmsi marchali]
MRESARCPGNTWTSPLLNMKHMPVEYCGCTAMDRRCAAPMMPWIINEIKKKNVPQKVNLLVASGFISAYVTNKEKPLLKHSLRSTLKPQIAPPSSQDSKGGTFLYMIKGDEGLYDYHLFKAKDAEAVQELFGAMKEQSSSSRTERDRELPQRSLSSATALTSIGADISPSSSQFFEVLYVGKTKIAHLKVLETFIDDVLVKFRNHGLEKSKSTISNLLTDGHQLKQQSNTSNNFTNIRRDSVDSNASELGSVESVASPTSPLGGSVESFASQGVTTESSGLLLPKRPGAVLPPETTMRNRAASTGSVMMSRRDSSVKENEDLNRTMLFQVGRLDLRLISPDRKKVLLHKQLRDVASCVHGIKNPEHFGFICRENGVDRFVGYIFKCQSDSVADDLVAAITQAFEESYVGPGRKERPVFSCEHCPMVWFSKLYQEIEGQSDRKTQSIIFSRLEMLPENEQEVVVTKYKGAEAANGTGTGMNLADQNHFLMMLLRAHCEDKQTRHVHDTAENRSEFLNQYLNVGVGSTIFMKAKRSLTNSFDHLMKRKGSKDDFGLGSQNQLNANYNKTGVQSPVGSGMLPIADTSPDSRPRSLRVSPEQQISINTTSPKSPMMDIFLKVGNSPKMSPTESGEANNRLQQSGSWRQAILNRVVTPSKDQDNKEAAKNANLNAKKTKLIPIIKRTKDELRALWKKAINQQLILIRMEKENARLRVSQEEATVKRIKLEYDELSSCNRQLVEVWDLLVSKESKVSTKCDNQMLLQAIKQGVPRGKRGEVWQFLAEQFCMKQPPLDAQAFPNYNTPYDLLLKQLTSQQHAILIDLGRTFPNHPYFSSPLGPGQLALFNLLKAYSLLDHEVGYCQGLSFVAGVLLLHMSEDQAFFLLRHLMFHRGLRKLYLPDMAALQLHLYQLSRLLHDRLPSVYNHFDKHEVSPTLYAAPWLLTLFASQFPLGFVTRVFDLLFLESSEQIFRVALALLEEHQDQLLCCDSFEEIMEYLKIKVPAVDKVTLERVMKRVFYPDTEMARQLNEYRVEYQVLQEEMLSVKPQIENIEKLELLNKQLTQQNAYLNEQLQLAMGKQHRLELTRSHQQSNIQRLELNNRNLEVTIFTMGTFIQQLADSRADIDIPGDVRRIVAQLSVAERRRNNNSGTSRIIEDNNNKYEARKSLSANKDARLMKTQSMIETPYPLKSALSQPNLGTKLEKVSSFFAISHNHIKHQRGQMAAISGEDGINEAVDNSEANDENDSKSVNIDIQMTGSAGTGNTVNVGQKDNALKYEALDDLEKSVSLPRNTKLHLKSSKSAYELGSIRKIPTTKLEDTNSESITNLSGTIHPLDTCSDVNFKYGGTTKLKSIKPIRAGSGQIDQSDNINKEIQQNPQILSR